jgi:hypothetical protein
MLYEKSNLKIDSDFQIMDRKKGEDNIDLIIPIDNRCVNLYMYNSPKYIKSRVQFPKVKSIFIRFCVIEDNNICTIHFLGDSGIHSTMANFEMNYSETYIKIIDNEFSVDFKMLEEEHHERN